jgi:hypothetical protein
VHPVHYFVLGQILLISLSDKACMYQSLPFCLRNGLLWRHSFSNVMATPRTPPSLGTGTTASANLTSLMHRLWQSGGIKMSPRCGAKLTIPSRKRRRHQCGASRFGHRQSTIRHRNIFEISRKHSSVGLMRASPAGHSTPRWMDSQLSCGLRHHQRLHRR